jgi:Ni/Co efflux regulator RcnB
MTNRLKPSALLTVTIIFVTTTSMGEPEHVSGARGHGPSHPHASVGHAAMPAGEPHPGPEGYQRVAEPKGWNARPSKVNRAGYQHNYRAARSYRIGPYHAPSGWRRHYWAFGQRLPRAYWASPYILADYWLFSLEVPPVGYEWVRVGNDAILVNTATGEILQVEYAVFA